MNRRLPAALVLLVLAAASASAQYPDPTIIARPGDWISPDPRNRLNPYNPLNDEPRGGFDWSRRFPAEVEARSILTDEEQRAAIPADALWVDEARADVARLPVLPPDAEPVEVARAAEAALERIDARRATIKRMRRFWKGEFGGGDALVRRGSDAQRREAASRIVGALEVLRRLDKYDAEAISARGQLRSMKMHAAWRRLKALVF